MQKIFACFLTEKNVRIFLVLRSFWFWDFSLLLPRKSVCWECPRASARAAAVYLPPKHPRVNASTAKGLAVCPFPGPSPSAAGLYLENAGLSDSPDACIIRHASGCTLGRKPPHLLSKPPWVTFELLAFQCVKTTYHNSSATFIRDHFRNMFLNISQLVMLTLSWVHGNRVLSLFCGLPGVLPYGVRVGFAHLLSPKSITLGLDKHRKHLSPVA